MVSSALTRRLRIVVYQEGDWLCAHSVDFNLCAQAKTMASLYRAIHKLIAGHVVVRRRHNMQPFLDLPPAPRKYRDMWERSIELPEQVVRIPRGAFEIPAPRVRVLIATPAA